MMLSSSASALRGAYRSLISRAFTSYSSSSVRGRMVTGTHDLRIERYPFVQKSVITGKAVTSAAFNVGGHQWQFHYYPNGTSSETADSVCAGLQLTTRNPVPWEAVAEYKVSFLGRGSWETAYSCAGSGLFHFDTRLNYHTKVITMEEMGRILKERLLDDDDCLKVRCQVTALKLDTECDE